MVLPQDPVQASIQLALSHYNYDDAIFLSERLFAEAVTDCSLYLLASCYYQAGKKTQAYSFLTSKGCPTPKCKYLYGKCCYDIGKLDEAETILSGGSLSKSRCIDDVVTEFEETASFALSLLADIYRKTERSAKAIEFYQHSLALNPFLWSSFSKLCQLGGRPDANKVFQPNNVQAAMNSVKSMLFSPLPFQPQQQSHIGTPILPDYSSGQLSVSSTPANASDILNELNTPEKDLSLNTPEMITTKGDNSSLLLSYKQPPPIGRKLLCEAVHYSPATPSFGVLPLDTQTPGVEYSLSSLVTPSPGLLTEPLAPKKASLLGQSQQGSNAPVGKLVFGHSTSNTKEVAASTVSIQRNLSSALPRRRSKRILDNQNSSSVKENSKVQSRNKHTSPKSVGRKHRSLALKSQEDLNVRNKSSSVEKPATVTSGPVYSEFIEAKQRQSACAFLGLLREIGTAYSNAQMFASEAAIEQFKAIPLHQYKTGWVLTEVGKAYLELAEYQKAEDVFKELRLIEPYHIKGMEIYSTVLFHLQREVALSALAHDMVELDKNCPETWCVNGNCFSLQKEHDTAIKFLHRAVQVDPEFAYAYTLLGHEYTLSEDFDKAMSAFRNALRVDSRHYNAWYGLGMIYYKKEKFPLAEVHFKKALAINPQSSLLLCHIGLVQHALQKHDLALETLNQAVSINPENPLCLFHRASMLVANDHLQAALEELEKLKILTPKESLVYFLIGKVHKKLGNAHLSMLNFSWATDLDPKGANNQIKEAIDKRYVTDDDEPSIEEPSLDESVLLMDTPEGTLSPDTSVIMDADDSQQLQANESDESL